MSEECNVDDILCQVGVLQNLRGLQAGMGNEAFLNEFPELQGLDSKLTAKIESSTESLKTAVAKCGRITSEEVAGPIELNVKMDTVLEPGTKVKEVSEEE